MKEITEANKVEVIQELDSMTPSEVMDKLADILSKREAFPKANQEAREFMSRRDQSTPVPPLPQ